LSPMLMKIPRGCKMIIVMVLPLIGKEAMAAAVETRRFILGCCTKVAPAGRCASRRTAMVPHYYSLTSLMQRSGDGDVESLLFLMPFMCSFFHFYYVLDVILRLMVEM
jgi:hypothetical protein